MISHERVGEKRHVLRDPNERTHAFVCFKMRSRVFVKIVALCGDGMQISFYKALIFGRDRTADAMLSPITHLSW